MDRFESNNISYEISGLKKDKITGYYELSKRKMEIAESLINGQMGKDINDIVFGNTRIKISLWKRIGYKWNIFCNKLLKTLQ